MLAGVLVGILFLGPQKAGAWVTGFVTVGFIITLHAHRYMKWYFFSIEDVIFGNFSSNLKGLIFKTRLHVQCKKCNAQLTPSMANSAVSDLSLGIHSLHLNIPVLSKVLIFLCSNNLSTD